MAEFKENVIEWLNGQDHIGVTFNQRKFISKVKKLAEKYPDQVTILAENEDGSITANLPLKALKLSIIPARELGEDQKEIMRNRLKKARSK